MTTEEGSKNLFDGVHIDPNFVVALKLLFANVMYAGRASGTGVTSIAQATYTKVTPTINFAQGINWDAANHRFIVTTAGYYSVACCVTYTNTATAEEINASIYLNGSLYSETQSTTNATTEGGVSHSDILKCGAGDYIELYTWHNGIARGLFNDSHLVFLSVAKQ